MTTYEEVLENTIRLKTALDLPIVKKYCDENPDYNFYAYTRWDGAIELGLDREIHAQEDITDTAEYCDSKKYIKVIREILFSDQDLNGTGQVVFTKKTTLNQYYSEDELELLRALGKLAIHTSKYEALTC
jgi:hypothetical protein